MIELFKGDKAHTLLNDQFKKTNIDGIYVRSYRSMFGDLNHTGEVKFVNGNTKSEQKFKGDSFDDVVLQIKAFIESL